MFQDQLDMTVPEDGNSSLLEATNNATAFTHLE